MITGPKHFTCTHDTAVTRHRQEAIGTREPNQDLSIGGVLAADTDAAQTVSMVSGALGTQFQTAEELATSGLTYNLAAAWVEGDQIRAEVHNLGHGASYLVVRRTDNSQWEIIPLNRQHLLTDPDEEQAVRGRISRSRTRNLTVRERVVTLEPTEHDGETRPIRDVRLRLNRSGTDELAISRALGFSDYQPGLSSQAEPTSSIYQAVDYSHAFLLSASPGLIQADHQALENYVGSLNAGDAETEHPEDAEAFHAGLTAQFTTTCTETRAIYEDTTWVTAELKAGDRLAEQPVVTGTLSCHGEAWQTVRDRARAAFESTATSALLRDSQTDTWQLPEDTEPHTEFHAYSSLGAEVEPGLIDAGNELSNPDLWMHGQLEEGADPEATLASLTAGVQYLTGLDKDTCRLGGTTYHATVAWMDGVTLHTRTDNVGDSVSYLVTCDAAGQWVFQALNEAHTVEAEGDMIQGRLEQSKEKYARTSDDAHARISSTQQGPHLQYRSDYTPHRAQEDDSWVGELRSSRILGYTAMEDGATSEHESTQNTTDLSDCSQAYIVTCNPEAAPQLGHYVDFLNNEDQHEDGYRAPENAGTFHEGLTRLAEQAPAGPDTWVLTPVKSDEARLEKPAISVLCCGNGLGDHARTMRTHVARAFSGQPYKIRVDTGRTDEHGQPIFEWQDRSCSNIAHKQSNRPWPIRLERRRRVADYAPTAKRLARTPQHRLWAAAFGGSLFTGIGSHMAFRPSEELDNDSWEIFGLCLLITGIGLLATTVGIALCKAIVRSGMLDCCPGEEKVGCFAGLTR